MRSKEELLKEAVKASKEHFAYAPSASNLTVLMIEALVDIRDILEQRLISLDNTILKHIIPK